MGLFKRLVWMTGGRVMSGPFKGLQFRSDSVCGQTGPKILGTYELELHAVIKEIIDAKPALIVDVGAAEGYYAVGLARAIPRTDVIAFEAMAEGRDLLCKVAGENGVRDRIHISGFCNG